MRKFLILSLNMLLLSACEKENDFSYLIKHPDALRQAVSTCQTTNENSPYCMKVMAIAKRLDQLSEQEMYDPIELGMYILNAQSACVTAQTELDQAKTALRALDAKQANPQDISAAQQIVDAKQQTYDEKQQEVQILYAVLGRNSPE